MQERSNVDRLADIAHFVIARTHPWELGATRLNKTLWRVDCAAYRRWGRSLTGLTHYKREEFGPVPQGIRRALRTLRDEGKISEGFEDTPLYPRREFRSLEEPDLEQLSREEIDLIHRILADVLRMTAREASEQSHDAFWKEQPLGALMSVGAGALCPEEPSVDAISWADQEMQRLNLS